MGLTTLTLKFSPPAMFPNFRGNNLGSFFFEKKSVCRRKSSLRLLCPWTRHPKSIVNNLAHIWLTELGNNCNLK